MKTMKKILKSLPFQLLLGVIIGIVLGLISNEAVMNVIVTIKFVLGELINFCVPLIVIGFIAPSITKLGKNASRILGVAVLLAYVSSVLAALGSMAAGYGLIPHLSIVSEVDGLKELPEIVFQLEIPQIMSVMSALAFSILIGLAATWTKAETVIRLLDEFQQIVLMIVSKIVIPILPVIDVRNIRKIHAQLFQSFGSQSPVLNRIRCAENTSPCRCKSQLDFFHDFVSFHISVFVCVFSCYSQLFSLFSNFSIALEKLNFIR